MADGGEDSLSGAPAGAGAGHGTAPPRLIGTLDPVLRPYGWGSTTAIPSILGVPGTGAPVAEAWYGAHPSAPSRFHSSSVDEPLTEVIARDPDEVLGADVARRYGDTLPFLVKLLAAAQPLSIQVHPSAEQAAAGFAREEAEGVPLDASRRLYRDPFAKPEVMVALEPFDMMCGFRGTSESAELIDRLGSALLAPIADALDPGGADALRGATDVVRGLRPDRLRGAIEGLVESAGGVTDGPHATACGWLARLGRDHPEDIGVLLALLMNHRRLEPFEACFLPARTLHVYLHGTGVEVMGNSDNVLRAGLTPKHVAVDDMFGILDFSPSAPSVLAGPGMSAAGGGPSGPWSYPVPADEFAVELLPVDAEVAPTGPEVLLAIAGGSTAEAPGCEPLDLSAGTAVFVGADIGGYRLTGDGTVVRVRVGSPS